MEYGHTLKDRFLLGEGYVNLNHGSFGTVPRSVMDRHTHLLYQQEERPDCWFRGEYQKLQQQCRRDMAEFMDAPLDSVCFVENTSTGVNACLRYSCSSSDARILLLDCAYPMVKNALTALQSQGLAGRVTAVPISWPLSAPEQVTAAVVEELKRHPRGHFSLAIFSHIVSFPAAILPVEELAAVAKEHGIARVIVDGAHTPGHLPISVASCFAAGVDAYIGNCHKWLFCPKGTAVMCLAPSYPVHPLVISSEWRPQQQGQVEGADATEAATAATTAATEAATVGSSNAWAAEQYAYTGTRDYVPMCCVSAGIAFHKSLGGSEALMARNRALAKWGRDTLVSMFGTQAACPVDMQPCMLTVRLPTDDKDKAAGLYAHMMETHSTSVAVQVVAGKAWLRLSVQAYIDKGDIETCGKRILAFYGQ